MSTIQGALGRLSRDLAIDLGTDRTRVYVQGRGVMVDEPTVLALSQEASGTKSVVASGATADSMQGRSPRTIAVVRPINAGAIEDFSATEQLLRTFLGGIGIGKLVRPRAVVAVRHDMPEILRRAMHDCAVGAGCREVRLIPSPLAAALGAGLPLFEARGTLLVDIGAGTTDVAVMSLGGIVSATSIKVGGDKMDAAIQESLLEQHGLHLARQDARRLREAQPSGEAGGMVLRPRELATGRTIDVRIPDENVQLAMRPAMEAIVTALREVLSTTPPEICSDILDSGMLLTGGASQTVGLAELLRSTLGLAVLMSERPGHAVIEGAGTAIETPDLLAELVFR